MPMVTGRTWSIRVRNTSNVFEEPEFEDEPSGSATWIDSAAWNDSSTWSET